ncbi:MAG TPA: GGDEF domain-containing protein, partial [Chromatiaceae bacterium]|nr:GGDEF domain-containing protein [Chromatiaceae bacterium]
PSLADETPLDTQCRNTNGKSFQARMEFSPAHMDGEPCTQITIRDQGNTNELEEKLRELQRLDLHTGLLNRDTFVQECDERLSGSDREHAHLMIVSLDNVQEVYHISGIKAADSVVLDVSGIIRSLVPDSAICAHVSDSSFGILIKGSELGTAESLGEEIRQAVEEHIFENTKRFVAPTCSIGIVACGDYARTAGHEYIGLAFRACESASSMGGNRVCVYNNSLIDEECLDEEEPGVEAGNVLALTRQALENDGFSLVYQPIVSLQGDTRENYAVMLRLPGENGKTIMPDEFLKPAENADLMSQIDRWVIKNAIEELARQRKEGRKINFFLNVSSQGIQDQEFLLWVCDCLRDCQAKGAWIVFQLKEADVRTNIQASKQLIEGLRKIRCQVALDRFGRTPQSRGLLKHIKFDFVKLAPDFMDNLADNQEKQEELGAANELAQSFDIKTIATAVEDANSLAVLWTIGVNYIQGYFLQDPSDTITFDFNGA